MDDASRREEAITKQRQWLARWCEREHTILCTDMDDEEVARENGHVNRARSVFSLLVRKPEYRTPLMETTDQLKEIMDDPTADNLWMQPMVLNLARMYLYKRQSNGLYAMPTDVIQGLIVTFRSLAPLSIDDSVSFLDAAGRWERWLQRGTTVSN